MSKVKPSGELTLKFQKITNTAKIPTKTYPEDAGIDFYSDDKITVTGGSTVKIKTGIRCEVPKGFCLVGRDRSGLASTTSAIVKAGVIDEGYRGEVQIIMANHGSYPIVINRGDKVAQFLLLPVPRVNIIEAEVDITSTERKEKGFGSSDTIAVN